MKAKKVLITVLTAIMIVALALSYAVSLFPRVESVKAETSSTVSEIFDTNYFKESSMNALYAALTGKSNATYEDVEKLVYPNGRDGEATPVASDFFREKHSGTNVKVTFNGIEWYAMQLNVVRKTYTSGDGTPKNAGDVILTLWQAESKFTYKFSNTTTNDIGSNVLYPSNMYSTSEIRVKALNNGGYYSTSLTEAEQYDKNDNAEYTISDGISNIYAPFTVKTAKNSCVDFIVQPKDVEYQETEVANDTYYSGHKFQNDCYGVDTTSTLWYTADHNYNKDPGSSTYEFGRGDPSKPETNYNYWQNDYIWLPSMAEVNTPASNSAFKGNWKCDTAAKTETGSANTSKLCWARSGIYDHDIRYALYIGALSWSWSATTTVYGVRPALHLNLTQSNESIGCALPTPLEDTYTGAKLGKVIPDFEKLDAGAVSRGAEYDPSTGTFSATDAGVYTLEVTPKTGYIWRGGGNDTKTYTFTINPAEITVSYDEDFKSDNRYVYHTDERTHKLRIPAGADGADYNEKYINLSRNATEKDKQSVTVYYHIEKHKESEHQKFEENELPGLSESVKTLPDDGNALTGWAKYTDGDTNLNVNEPKGYCVFYKITADNHKTRYGYFSVHIATEVLKIKTYGNLGTPTYGDKVDYLESAAALKTYIEEQSIITEILDNNNENRLDKLDKNAFSFYLYQKDTAGDIEKALGGRLDAGDYYLGVKYIEPGSENFIHFVWNSTGNDGDGQPKDGEHPKLTIKAKEVTLVWKGVEDDEAEKAKVSDKAIAGYVNGFSWAYDGNPKMPTATFTDVDESEQDVTVTVDGAHTDAATYTAKATAVTNYIFKNSTQVYKILKAKNGWFTPFECYTFSVGGEPDEVEAVPYFGTVTKKYYTDATWQTPYGKATWEAGTYYVKLTVSESKNYDGLDSSTELDQSIYTFTVNECDHDYVGQPYKFGTHGGKEQHWQECKLCRAPGNYEDHTAADDGELEHNATEHWLVCQYCKQQFSKSSHTFEAGDITKAAKCNEEGEQEYVCECGEKDPQVHTLEKIPHTLVQNDEKSGNKWYSDGDHHWNLCSVCNEHVDEVEHVKTTHEMQEPTCTEDGHNEYQDCLICGHVFKEKQVIKAPGYHTLGDDKDVQKEATCTVSGWARGTCAKCGRNDLFETPPLGHKCDKEEITEPKCTEDGESIMVCSRVGCDYHDETTRKTLPAAHQKEWKLRKEPTETAVGYEAHYECKVCHSFLNDDGSEMDGKEISDITIPKLGTPSVSGGNSDWIKDNWWWLVIVAAVILLLILLIFIISSARNRRRERERLERERERDRQFETFMKMQMMNSYNMGGFGGVAPPDGAAAIEGTQFALPPASQEMMNAAVSAAVNTALHIIEEHGVHGGYTPDREQPFGQYGYDNAQHAQTEQPQGFAQPGAQTADFAQPGAQYGQQGFAQPGAGQQTAYGSDFGGQYGQNAQNAQNAQSAPYGQPYTQSAQGYAQPNAQPFVAPDPQSAQPTQPAQPDQPAFTDDGGFYDSYKKPKSKSKYDDDDDDDDD